MLELCVKDDRHDSVDALPNTRDDLPSCLDSIFCLNVASLELADLLVVELVADNGVASHFGH